MSRSSTDVGRARPFELGEDIAQAVDATAAPNRGPARAEEPCEGGAVDRLDFLAQPRQRAPAQHAQHVLVAPFAFDAAGSEVAVQQRAGRLQPSQRLAHERFGQRPARCRFAREERRMRAAEAQPAGRRGRRGAGLRKTSGTPMGGDTPRASR